ncbi:GNAT family N-acetyltransferase [Musicola paradisiaca]|uniref:GNAT family N-acetyltransferase n=1 Tax=Musicola paradisiaca TaxID=69223 RepID=UPI0003C7F4C8|nr:GNAT family N-acetyltransferase [Musicola paradisiaca]
MRCNITDKPSSLDEEYVIDSLWKHNEQYEHVDIHPLFVTIKDDDKIVAGLVARTWWGGLEIQYLWVNEQYRKRGLGSSLMKQAEEEAVARNCHMAYVDTFSFQAKTFYEQLGYAEYGALADYAHKYTRHYLSKHL